MTPPRRGDRRLPRDQDESAFTPILEALRARVNGAIGVALVDNLGETVDYAGEGDPFEIRVAAAHLQLLYTPSGVLGRSNLRSLAIRGERVSYLVHVLPDGYGLTVILQRRCFTVSARALAAAEAALHQEAGWGGVRLEWEPATVHETAKGAPWSVSTGEAPRMLTVFGRLACPAPRERAYRAVIDATGEELTLVREPGGFWYVQRGSGP